MLWVIIIVVAVLILGAMRKRTDNPPSPSVSDGHRGRRVADVLEDKSVFAVEMAGNDGAVRSREQVDSMFSGARSELPRIRAQARSATRTAKKYEADARKARPAGPPDTTSFQAVLPKIAFIRGECEKALDSLFFSDEQNRTKYGKLLEDMTSLADEIEAAIDDINETTALIRQGDYDEFWVAKPEREKKPRP